jgi:hypothetical protein
MSTNRVIWRNPLQWNKLQTICIVSYFFLEVSNKSLIVVNIRDRLAERSGLKLNLRAYHRVEKRKSASYFMKLQPNMVVNGVSIAGYYWIMDTKIKSDLYLGDIYDSIIRFYLKTK